MSELVDNELYEMDIYPADSGLPVTVWVGPRGAPPLRHDVRIKVNMAHGNRMSISNAAIVAVRPALQLVAGQLSATGMHAVSDRIRLNEAAIIEHWEGRISGIEFGRRMQRLP